jgi:hypothetical protein
MPPFAETESITADLKASLMREYGAWKALGDMKSMSKGEFTAAVCILFEFCLIMF